MTYTHPYTVTSQRAPYTLPNDLHAHRSREQKTTYTKTYTTYTHTDLHVCPPLYKRGATVGTPEKQSEISTMEACR